MNNLFESNILSQKIKEFRKKNNLTQEEFAELIDCNVKFLSRVETGKNNFFVHNIIKILNTFNISFDDLINNNLDETIDYKNKIIEKVNFIKSKNYNEKILIDLVKAINGEG